MSYMYKAALYCTPCGESICIQLRAEHKAPTDELDYATFDSDDFPKLADTRHNESDSPDHCERCRTFLHNPLTSEGYRYAKEQLDRTGATSTGALTDTLREWAAWYDFTYWTAEDCADDMGSKVPGWYSREAY